VCLGQNIVIIINNIIIYCPIYLICICHFKQSHIYVGNVNNVSMKVLTSFLCSFQWKISVSSQRNKISVTSDFSFTINILCRLMGDFSLARGGTLTDVIHRNVIYKIWISKFFFSPLIFSSTLPQIIAHYMWMYFLFPYCVLLVQ